MLIRHKLSPLRAAHRFSYLIICPCTRSGFTNRYIAPSVAMEIQSNHNPPAGLAGTAWTGVKGDCSSYPDSATNNQL
ncbi:MAG: hypothetical protein H8E87_04605 [FCB group bacterium]|nr:hypothetical protein [FCB group bacterium]